METQVEISNVELPEKLEIQEEVQKFLEKFSERWKISKFKLDVDVHSPEGRKKYSFHAKVIASDKVFTIKAVGWDVPSTMKDLLDKLGRKIGKSLKKEKKEKIAKGRKEVF